MTELEIWRHFDVSFYCLVMGGRDPRLHQGQPWLKLSCRKPDLLEPEFQNVTILADNISSMYKLFTNIWKLFVKLTKIKLSLQEFNISAFRDFCKTGLKQRRPCVCYLCAICRQYEREAEYRQHRHEAGAGGACQAEGGDIRHTRQPR